MNRSVLAYYKIPLLLSAVLTIVLLALNITRDPLQIAGLILGALIGTFVLDSEYLIFAYFLEPDHDYSRTLKTFIEHGDLKNAVHYLSYNRDVIHEKTLNSALFQMAVALLSVFVITSSHNIFAKSLVMAVFAQTLYRFSEYYFNDKLDEWFWALKTKPSRSNAILYVAALLAVFVYCLYLYS